MQNSKVSPDGQKLREKAALVQRGGARAAVLGVNDGLVSTLCLVVGVAAAGGNQAAVLLAGFAGLLAGAISMAAGEWISVKSQVELFEGILDEMRRAFAREKKVLVDNLAHTLAAHGMEHKTAHQAAADMAKHDEKFMNAYATEVIGVNQDELGAPWRVAGLSFVLFAGGSLVPLIAWMTTLSHTQAIIVSIACTLVASLFVGGFVARSSGKNIAFGASRQLLIVLGSAIVTYGIGAAFGVVIG